MDLPTIDRRLLYSHRGPGRREIMNDFYWGQRARFNVHNNILTGAVHTIYTDDVIVKRLLYYLLLYRLTNTALFDLSFSRFVFCII